MSDASNPPDKVPVAACVEQAYAFAARHWREFIPAAIVVSLISLGAGLVSRTPTLELGFQLISLLASAAFACAVLRRQLRDDFVAPVGLTLGADEFRVFGVSILVSLALLLVMLLPTVFLLAFLLAGSDLSEAEVERLGSSPEALMERIAENFGATDILVVALFSLPILWFGAKLFTAGATSFGERRSAIITAWEDTRGNAWRILGAIVLTAGPYIAVNLLLFGTITSLLADQPLAAVFALGLASVFAELLRIPIIALSGILYRGLRTET